MLVVSTLVVLAIPEGGLGAVALLKHVLIMTLQDSVDESLIALILVPLWPVVPNNIDLLLGTKDVAGSFKSEVKFEMASVSNIATNDLFFPLQVEGIYYSLT